MSRSRKLLARSPETLLVSLARRGDQGAFEELLGRRAAWIRTLLLRCCNNAALADDLAQQTFLHAWRSIGQLRRSSRFGPWLKRVAITTWLQHVRRKDPLAGAEEATVEPAAASGNAAIGMDLDRALATLRDHVRLCVVLSYHEGMTHEEIAGFTGLPEGTVKSHIRRGSRQLREQLAAYRPAPGQEGST